MNTSSVKNRRIRAALLELLKTEYPGALDLKALQFTMDSLGYPMPHAMLEAHMRYLEEKGFLRIHKRRGGGVELMFACLTAEGWDLLDGIRSEGGVDGRI